MDGYNYLRLVRWMKNPNREPAQTAFTAGALRDAARAFEDALPDVIAPARAQTLEDAAQIADSEPLVWDTNAPKPQQRIAAKIRALSGATRQERGGE